MWHPELSYTYCDAPNNPSKSEMKGIMKNKRSRRTVTGSEGAFQPRFTKLSARRKSHPKSHLHPSNMVVDDYLKSPTSSTHLGNVCENHSHRVSTADRMEDDDDLSLVLNEASIHQGDGQDDRMDADRMEDDDCSLLLHSVTSFYGEDRRDDTMDADQMEDNDGSLLVRSETAFHAEEPGDDTIDADRMEDDDGSLLVSCETAFHAEELGGDTMDADRMEDDDGPLVVLDAIAMHHEDS